MTPSAPPICAGQVRVVRHDGSLLLLLREREASHARRWDVLNLLTGEVETVIEKWLIHDTRPWAPELT